MTRLTQIETVAKKLSEFARECRKSKQKLKAKDIELMKSAAAKLLFSTTALSYTQ